MLRRLNLLRTNGSEERIASNINVIKIGVLRTTLAETSNRNSLVLGLLVTANVVPSSQILFNLNIEATRSSESFFIATPMKTSKLT
jgi:hypothetical protein